jgi:hypothetical protein
MRPALLFAVGGLAIVLGQPPVRVKMSFQTSSATSAADKGRLMLALERGLYAESLIVRGADSLFQRTGLIPDSVPRASRPVVFVIRGAIDAIGDTLDVRMELLNIILRRMLPEDRIRAPRAVIDSLVFEQGRRYAAVLAQSRQ